MQDTLTFVMELNHNTSFQSILNPPLIKAFTLLIKNKKIAHVIRFL